MDKEDILYIYIYKHTHTHTHTIYTHTDTMEYYSAIKIMSFAVTRIRMSLEVVTLSERKTYDTI